MSEGDYASRYQPRIPWTEFLNWEYTENHAQARTEHLVAQKMHKNVREGRIERERGQWRELRFFGEDCSSTTHPKACQLITHQRQELRARNVDHGLGNNVLA